MKFCTDEFAQWLIDLRRDFHKHPEISGLEKRTTSQICKVLKDLDVTCQVFDDLTGVVGLLEGKKQNYGKNRTIALRADIDALPMQERTDTSYKSQNDGVMHACGHDANTAIVLGVAKKIKDSGLLDRINGNIKCIFQPAEEQLGGARAMIEKGVLDNPRVDRIIAAHMDPNLSVGTIGVFSHIGHASCDPFELVITGKGTHGARPHKGINPITAGGFFVISLDSLISRFVKPGKSAAISAGSFSAGIAGNVIPEQAILKGSIRTHDEKVRVSITKALRDLVRGIDEMYGTNSELTFAPGAPLGVNDSAVCEDLRATAIALLGKERVKTLPFIMGSEDFYFFTRECPGAIMRFGCAGSGDKHIQHPLHSPYFDIDEDVLGVGVEILFKTVEQFFQGQ